MPEPDIDHYVAPFDESLTVEVDSVRLGAHRSNLWLDAWRDLRGRPLFYVALLIVAVVLLMAVFPTLFTHVRPNNDCVLGSSNGGPTPGHPLGFTRQGCDVY